MILCPKNKSDGGLQYPPNHYIIILGVMKGHSEMGQSQKSEGTAIANQLHKCHIYLVKCSNYITSESVAILSHSQKQRMSSVANMFYRISCINVTVAKMSCQVLQKCHDAKISQAPLRWKMTPLRWKMTPPVENGVDPTDGKCQSDSIV